MIPSHMQKYALVPSILDSQTNPPFPVYPVSPFSALLCHETSFKIGALPLPHQLVACLPPAAWLLALSLHWVHSAVTSLVRGKDASLFFSSSTSRHYLDKIPLAAS